MVTAKSDARVITLAYGKVTEQCYEYFMNILVNDK